MKAKNFVKRGAKHYTPVYAMASFSQMAYIDSLIETSQTSNEKYMDLKRKSNEELTEGEAEEFISELLEIQRNPILGGFNYQQRDITKMLSKLNEKS